MTDPYSLNYIPCSKISAEQVLAYLCFRLDPDNPLNLVLDTSWGELSLDLIPALSSMSGLLGTMRIGMHQNAWGIELDRGRNGYSFVTIEALNRILPMNKFGDVVATPEIADGEVYKYNSTDFEPYALKSALDTLEQQLQDMQGRYEAISKLPSLDAILARISALKKRLGILDEEDWGEIEYIDDNGETNTYVFQSNADFREAGKTNQFGLSPNFNFAALTIPKAWMTKLRIGKSVTEIPANYLTLDMNAPSDTIHTYTVELPSTLQKIGNSFGSTNLRITGPLVVPASVTAIGDRFLWQVSAFTGPITVETNTLPINVNINEDLTAFNSNNPAYIQGITLTGTYAQTWKAAMPDIPNKRKLIVQ